MGKMFELLKQGLEEAIEFQKGNIKLRTKEVDMINLHKKNKNENVKKVRHKI